LKVGSLFTGYGGLDIAVGGDLAWYAEIEPAACQVLAHHYPGVVNLGDITKIDWSQVEPVDVITGGYPCQPFSHAGNRKGKNDVRHLWPNVLDAIRAVRPRYAILENVSGHLTLGFADVLADLAEIGWSCEWGTYRASNVGAPHRRERIFIVAYTDSEGSQGHNGRSGEASARGHGHAKQGASAFVANAQHDGSHGGTLTGSISASKEQGRLQQFEGCDSSTAADTDSQRHERSRDTWSRGAGSTDSNVIATDTSGDGHGQQLHARGMASVEGQTARSPQQRQRSRRESDSGSVDDAADTEGKGLQGRKLAAKDYQGKLARRRTTSEGNCNAASVDWGKYAPAIARWESVLDRPAPEPTIERNDKRRLNPQFVEWMMGLPDGWVTGHGLSAAKELKMLGNGVVPQQAHAAITQLLERITP
jgi:DNA (cytosine-5)-methyltransferase 1